MIIGIGESGQCWICGRDNQEMTSHHALPKHLKPVNNIVIPICVGCHKRLNLEDVNGMYSYLYALKKSVRETAPKIDLALKNLGELVKIRSTDKGDNE